MFKKSQMIFLHFLQETIQNACAKTKQPCAVFGYKLICRYFTHIILSFAPTSLILREESVIFTNQVIQVSSFCLFRSEATFLTAEPELPTPVIPKSMHRLDPQLVLNHKARPNMNIWTVYCDIILSPKHRNNSPFFLTSFLMLYHSVFSSNISPKIV